MSYRVCIPCAGTGSRLGGLTQYINKALVSIANRPMLSHLIEQFPPEAEFVIALGYKGHLIREFLMLAYPDRKFFFVEVLPFEGSGSGLGLSIQACKQYLQQPFIFISCDTLVEEPIPAPDQNWMGYSEEVSNLNAYRTIVLSSTGVSAISEKGLAHESDHKAYIGLAGIRDYKEFWMAMEQGGDAAIELGESLGMRSLLTTTVKAIAFTWHDTGNPQSLSETRQIYFEHDAPNILEKANESIWFVGDNVIKFSDDKKFISNRVNRAQKLQGFVPEVTGADAHMYRYQKSPGVVLSKLVSLNLFDLLLKYCTHFWKQNPLTDIETVDFQESCMKFYRDKTLERVTLFYKKFDKKDGRQPINGIEMVELGAMLNSIDWAWLANGLPGRFHGDFHFENILWDASNQKFTFLDWRQDFSGDLDTGDVYYDLAKILHGLIVSHELIAGNFYRVDWDVDGIEFDFHRKYILVECEQYFSAWLNSHGYDRKKVGVLTALIYLNIAPLHHYPYSLLLYALGKSMLKSELEK